MYVRPRGTNRVAMLSIRPCRYSAMEMTVGKFALPWLVLSQARITCYHSVEIY
jgi:hypothetical protein